jgi:hypothetical protein
VICRQPFLTAIVLDVLCCWVVIVATILDREMHCYALGFYDLYLLDTVLVSFYII